MLWKLWTSLKDFCIPLTPVSSVSSLTSMDDAEEICYIYNDNGVVWYKVEV